MSKGKIVFSLLMPFAARPLLYGSDKLRTTQHRRYGWLTGSSKLIVADRPLLKPLEAAIEFDSGQGGNEPI